MTISKELMLAILSMDAYNRDYGASIGGLGGKGSKVGTTTVGEDSDILKDANGDRLDEDAGFYAVSYTMGAGVTGINSDETVISYRGTDEPISFANLNPWSDAQGGDIWNGYGSAAGSSNTNQAHLAAEFYQAVTETSDSDPRTGSAILTGHSLGGGLVERLAA